MEMEHFGGPPPRPIRDDGKRHHNKKAVKWLFNKSKGQRLNIFLLILANAIASLLSVAFAFAVQKIIDGAIDGDKQKLIYGAIFIVVIVIFQFIFRIVISVLTEYIRGKLEMLYKSHIFSEILKKRYEKISVYHSGELLNRLTSDVSVVAEGITSIVPTIVSAVVRLVSAVIALIVIDFTFSFAFIICGLLVFFSVVLLRGKLKSFHKTAQETDGKVRSYMQESIENLLAVKVFSSEDKIEKHSGELQKENFKVKMRRNKYSVLGHSFHNFVFSAGYIFALIYGAAKIYAGGLTYGSLSAILQLVNNVQVPFMSLAVIFPKYYSMIASGERLMEIEEIDNETGKHCDNLDKLYNDMQSICGNNLVFSYGRNAVLKNADFEINKGDFVVVTGISGIGKSTLIKLLLGVYMPQCGEIYFSENNGNKIHVDDGTRQLFSYVPQGNMLFSGTLKDNITFIKNDAKQEEIDRAIKISCSYDFISELPDGINTVIGEGGMGLSEGQIQRIAIARALLTNAKILILDEATSALDEETEKQFLSNLKEYKKDITLILISHKKAAFSICDKEMTIKNKKIITNVIKKSN